MKSLSAYPFHKFGALHLMGETGSMALGVLLTCSFILIGQGYGLEVQTAVGQTEGGRSETVHLYLLAVPQSSMSRLSQKLRQDDEDVVAPALNFAQTGQYLGQIIQGVLGGDVAPVFAGSVKFVEEPTAQANLATFLGTIAPALNLGLREIFVRTQTALGFGPTTPKAPQTEEASQPPEMAQQPTLQVVDVAVPSNGSATKSPTILREQPEVSTTSWQYVINQIQGEATTVPPLPIIRRRTVAPVLVDGDDDDEGRRLRD